MDERNHFDAQYIADAPLFSARLTPHRSLSRGGFIALMAFVTLVSFAAGVMFLMMGAWPVFAFFGLNALIIYWAFKVNFRRAAATEDIMVTPYEIRVRRVSHRGQALARLLERLREETG